MRGTVSGVSGPDQTTVRGYIVRTITEGATMPTLQQVAERSRAYQSALLTKAGAADIERTIEGSLSVTVNHRTGMVTVERKTFHTLTKAEFLEVQNARY